MAQYQMLGNSPSSCFLRIRLEFELEPLAGVPGLLDPGLLRGFWAEAEGVGLATVRVGGMVSTVRGEMGMI